jgi:O-antigen/teichoic acid export membrane protein
LAWSLWKGLPTGNQKSSFDRKLLKGIWRFAAGMSGITVSALLLMQIDKVILSKIMSLENFGYYTLAGAMAGGLHIIIIPIYNSIFPRFSALAALHNDQVLIKLYHASTQLMAVLVLPAAMTLMVFSYDILLLWTGDSFISRNTAPLVSILTMGTAINALMVLPYTLQLAYGWTNISLKINIFLIVMMVPTIIILTNHYGPAGAASSWVILNVIYMLIGIPLTHSRLLKGEVKNWFNDFIYTFAVVLVTVLIGRYLFNNFISNISIILTVASVGLFSLFVAVLSSEHFRSLISLRILPGKSL